MQGRRPGQDVRAVKVVRETVCSAACTGPLAVTLQSLAPANLYPGTRSAGLRSVCGPPAGRGQVSGGADTAAMVLNHSRRVVPLIAPAQSRFTGVRLPITHHFPVLPLLPCEGIESGPVGFQPCFLVPHVGVGWAPQDQAQQRVGRGSSRAPPLQAPGTCTQTVSQTHPTTGARGSAWNLCFDST